jgi:hypothetical protein
MGSYSNPLLVSRFQAILAGQGDDRPSNRLRPSRQFQRRLNADEVVELVEAYEEGATQQELAARFGIHRTTVAAELDRHGFTNRRASLAPEQVTEAIDLYTHGWSLAKIGNHFSLYPSSIYYWLKKRGVTLRPRQGSSSRG